MATTVLKHFVVPSVTITKQICDGDSRGIVDLGLQAALTIDIIEAVCVPHYCGEKLIVKFIFVDNVIKL